MDDWGSVGVDVSAPRSRATSGRAQRAWIRKALVRSLREVFPMVEGARVRVRPSFGGAWEVAFSCSCPSRHGDVPADRGARADTVVESLASVMLARLFGHVTVEHAAARSDPDTGAWRVRLVMCV